MDAEEDEVILMVAEWMASMGMKRTCLRSQVGRATFGRNKFQGHGWLVLDYFVLVPAGYSQNSCSHMCASRHNANKSTGLLD